MFTVKIWNKLSAHQQMNGWRWCDIYKCIYTHTHLVTQSYPTLWDPMESCLTLLACQAPLSMEFSRWESWSGLPCLPARDLPNPGINPGLPHYRRILYQLSHKGNPRILEWVAYPFSTGSSWPRNWTGVSCIAGGFFTNWAIREPTVSPGKPYKTISTFNKIYL